MCCASEITTEAEIVPVLLDQNMETEMCRPCIKILQASGEMDVEIMEDV